MSQRSPSETKSIIEAVRQGDRQVEAEVIQLIRSFARHIWRGSLPAHTRDIEWEDVAQESCQRFFSVCLQSFSPRGSDRSYLYSTVRLTALEMARKACRRKKREEAEWGETMSNPVHGAEKLDVGIDVRRILSRLPDECRELLERIYFRGATYSQLAAELGMTESSVRSRLSRCIRRARQIVR